MEKLIHARLEQVLLPIDPETHCLNILIQENLLCPQQTVPQDRTQSIQYLKLLILVMNIYFQ